MLLKSRGRLFIWLLGAACTLSSVSAKDTTDPAHVRTRREIGRLTSAAPDEVPSVGAHRVLGFFADVAYTVTVARVEQNTLGTTTRFFAPIDGRDIAAFSVSDAGGERLTVRDYDRRTRYLSVTTEDGGRETHEYDLTKERPGTPLPPRIPPGGPEEGGRLAPGAGPAPTRSATLANVNLDVMIVFDTTAKNWATANGGMNAFAADAVARMNLAMRTSGIHATFRLAGVVTKTYWFDASGGMANGLNQALDDITYSRNAFDDVEALRTTYGADIVCLLVDTGAAFGSTGLAWVLNATSGNPAYAYSVCSVRAVSRGHTLTHEIGHNLGCGHAAYQTPSPGPELFSYSAGYYFAVGGNRYHTIMAYSSDGYGNHYDGCDYFSTPLRTYGSSGVLVGNSRTADNARTIRETMQVVSGYRAAVIGVPPAVPTGVVATRGAHTDKVVITWPRTPGLYYRVYRRDAETLAVTALGSWRPAGFYVNRSAVPGRRYWYYVKASRSPSGTYPSLASAREGGYRKLSPPSGLAASDGRFTGRISISWNAAWGAQFYRVFRAESPTGPKVALGSWQSSRLYTDYSVIPGKTYSYFVQAAVNASGLRHSSFSAANPGHRKLSPPVGVLASDGRFADRIAVSWQPVWGARYYRVFRAESLTGPKLALGFWQTGTVYNNTWSVPGRIYYYFVQSAAASTGWRPSAFSGVNTGWRSYSAAAAGKSAAATGAATSRQAAVAIGGQATSWLSEPAGDGVLYPLACSGYRVNAIVYDADGETWTPLLEGVDSPESVAVSGVQVGRRYRLEIGAAGTVAAASEGVQGVWFERQFEPPATLTEDDEAMPDSGLLGLPVERIGIPAGEGTVTVKLCSVETGVVQIWTGTPFGATVEIPIPAWNRWFWVGGWREADGKQVLSLWLRHTRD